MKEMERNNRVAMIAHGVINACMLFISVIGFVEHIVSAPVLVVLILLGIIPVLAEFICWKRDHATKAIKHLSLIGFALFYTVLLFTAQCNMVYAFVIPMMFAVMPYHDVKAFVLINVGTVVENILVVLLGATQGGFGYLGQDAGFIQISVMILLCITSIYATISNQKNTDENIESITAAQDRTEATLREVMEMSSRMETSVADITAELNKLETAFDSTKTAMEEVSAGSGESAAAIQQQTAQTEAIQEKVNTVGEVAETIGNNMEHTIEILDAGKEEMTGLKEQAEASARNSELAAQKLEKLDHYMQEMHSIVEIISKIANQTSLLALNASIEAARAGESGKGFAVVADQVRQLSINTAESAEDIVKYVSELKTNIDELATAMEETTQSLGEGSKKVEKSLAALEQMNGQMDSIRGRVDSIFDDIDTQTGVTKSFAMQMGNISESYSVLSKDCLQSGHRIFEVGRYLDKTRSDLVRGCSEITQQDWMRVFEVDHYVLTWRVYNNIVGFEHLQKKQVDNPAGCKLGKWLNRQTDERLVRSSEYTALVKAHNDLHHFATLSWQAKEDGNTEKALAYFNNTYGAFMEYDKALKHLQQRMKELGYNTDTQIAAFGGR